MTLDEFEDESEDKFKNELKDKVKDDIKDAVKDNVENKVEVVEVEVALLYSMKCKKTRCGGVVWDFPIIILLQVVQLSSILNCGNFPCFTFTYVNPLTITSCKKLCKVEGIIFYVSHYL